MSGGRPFEILKALERKALWLSSWMIHHANHLRPSTDGLKVGGHQASAASVSTILSVLYFRNLRPQDRIAVKPHASPIFHAIQYMFGLQSREKIENFRKFGGAQSYPSRTKDLETVDFSTGSVGLGVAQTLFSSLVQDYVAARGWMKPEDTGRYIAIVGDAEMDEGNIYEALVDGWKQDVRNLWWIVDYNRQSLDGVVREALWEKIERMFANFGWDVVILKYGKLMQAAFAESGGEALRQWIDSCPNQLYSALCFQGGAAFRKKILAEIGDKPGMAALIAKRDDAQLLELMSNLGGHDAQLLAEAFDSIDHDRPVCFLAYTIKGRGLPLQGHKDNHSGLMTANQMEEWRQQQNVRTGHEWDRFEGLDIARSEVETFLAQTPYMQAKMRRHRAPAVAVPETLAFTAAPAMSTQQGFGLILNELARLDSDFAKRIVTTSPDVTVSTNLGPWVNRRGLFARKVQHDTFKTERIPSTYAWEFSPQGQHIELGIAEMNLFLLLSALGLSHDINGQRLLPIGTLYDPFIQRGLDAMNYACYQDARFMLVATPSGISLGPEGGAHQSISTPLIGMAQPGLESFEPAFVDELAIIMRWGFEHMQRESDGGSVYLRLSTRSIEQVQRQITPELAADMIAGAYWMRPPGPNCQIVLAYSGALAPEAIQAAGLMAEDRRDVGLLAITSGDRLFADHSRHGAASHIGRLLESVPRDCAIVTMADGHPAGLAWLGGVRGHRTRALGVDHFGQSGALPDLFRHFGIDVEGALAAAEEISPGRPLRYLPPTLVA